MYASFYDAGEKLNDEDFREYILALKDYALYGIEYTSQVPMVNGLIIMAQPLLEAAAKRRAKQVKNGEYGILGGRKRKGETAEEYKARKDALRKSLMGSQSKTVNNPMGFQNETLNVDVDVKVDENEKVDVKEDGDVEENADVKANDKEYLNVNKNANAEVLNNSILTNTNYSSLTSKPGLNKTENGEELEGRRPQQEGVPSHSNETPPDRANPFNYKCGNYVNPDVEPSEPDWLDCDPNDFPPIIDEGWTPPPPELQRNEVIIPKEPSSHSEELKDEPAPFSMKKDRLDRLMNYQRHWAYDNKSRLLQEKEEYYEKACNIIDDDMPVVRRCFEFLYRGKGERLATARDKVHDLIMAQKPESEEDYIAILRDLWKFYIQDREAWDSKAGKPGDSLNPYRQMYDE